ncbi:MAG: hypothetical protein ACXVDJ_05165, partial [Tumebacillaceae bacterium]
EMLEHLADEQDWARAVGKWGHRYVREYHSWERLSEKIAEVMREDTGMLQKTSAAEREAEKASEVRA